MKTDLLPQRALRYGDAVVLTDQTWQPSRALQEREPTAHRLHPSMPAIVPPTMQAATPSLACFWPPRAARPMASFTPTPAESGPRGHGGGCRRRLPAPKCLVLGPQIPSPARSGWGGRPNRIAGRRAATSPLLSHRDAGMNRTERLSPAAMYRYTRPRSFKTDPTTPRSGLVSPGLSRLPTPLSEFQWPDR